MPRVHAGGLQTHITIEGPVNVDDNAGGYSTTWLEVTKMWARKVFLNGGDRNEAGEIVSRRQYTYTGRRRRDVTITSAMRVRDDVQTIAITSVAQDDTDRSAITLICEETPR